MQVEDMILISVDDHVIEPPDPGGILASICHDVSVRSMNQGRHTDRALPTMQGIQELVQP